MWAAVLAVLILLLGTVVLVVGYMSIARDLPSPDDLMARSATFKSTKIYDRTGVLLYEVMDPTGGRRTMVSIEDIPQTLIWATVATEDATFFRNPGFDPFAIARALYYNLSEGEIVSGASGITQQLAKNFYLTREQTLSRKIKEAVLAAEITRRYSKDQILEIYLNEIYYGNLAYGIGAAAETYFGKQVQDLTLAEAALLAGLPQSPVLWDPYLHPEAALSRRSVVLDLMVREGYITAETADRARAEPLNLRPQAYEIKAPHFVMYVRQLLEQQYGTGLYRSGLQVYTTLDLTMQTAAEKAAREHIATLKAQDATNAAVLAMDPQSGEILAMLGSVDFFDETIAGQVNVALQPRQPGSTIKPVVYVAAFERGWNPATMVMDVRTEYPNGDKPPYVPVNYDRKEHGPVSVRQALACSYNIPAVQTLYELGLPAALEMAQRLGIRSLNRTDYGLSLVLGGGEVTLLEMVGAYAAFANQGLLVSPQPILRVADYNGTVLFDRNNQPRHAERVLDARQAYLITDILSDNEARTPAYGAQNALVLSRPAAAKTGTTDDYRDSWVIGYTPDLVAGVWVGNSDGSPMESVTGVRGAGPIWHNFMETALAERPVRDFEMPPGIVSVPVCPISGHPRTEDCPPARTDLFLEEAVPSESCPVHTVVGVCKVSGERATEFCPPDQVEYRHLTVFPLAYRQWAEAQGFVQPPVDPCSVHTEGLRLQITYPAEGQTVGGIVAVQGTAVISDFSHYVLEYGVSHDPQGWGHIPSASNMQVEAAILGLWDTRHLTNGPHTLRVQVFNQKGQSAEARVRIYVYNEAPTPTATLTGSPTPTASPSSTASLTPSPTPTDVATPTETPTPAPVVGPTLVILPVTPTEPPAESPTPTAPADTPAPGPTLITLPTGTLTPQP